MPSFSDQPADPDEYLPKPASKALNVRLPYALYQRLREMSFRTGVKMNPFIVEAITDSLDAEVLQRALPPGKLMPVCGDPDCDEPGHQQKGHK